MTLPISEFPIAAARTFDEIEVGQIFELERAFSAQDVLAFAALSGGLQPFARRPNLCRWHGVW